MRFSPLGKDQVEGANSQLASEVLHSPKCFQQRHVGPCWAAPFTCIALTDLLLVITFCPEVDNESGHSNGYGDLEQEWSPVVFERAWIHLGTAVTVEINTKPEHTHRHNTSIALSLERCYLLCSPYYLQAVLIATGTSTCVKSQQLYKFREQLSFEGFADPRDKRQENHFSHPLSD